MALTINLVPGYVYTDNELDTAAKRNALGNPTISLEGSIGTIGIADNSVTTPKLVDGVLSADAAGRAKMADGFLSADATGRGKMQDGYLTAAKAEETFREGVAQLATSVWSTDGIHDTYTLTLDPAATAYTAGMRVVFKAATANGFPVKLNVNGAGAVDLVLGTTPLVAGRIPLNHLAEAIYDGTNFQLLNPAVTGAGLYTTAETALSAAKIIDVAHGLGAVPSQVRWVMRCKTAELGYSIGDEVDVAFFQFQSGGFTYPGLVGGASATNVWMNCAQVLLGTMDKGTRVGGSNIVAANWRVVGYALR